MSLVGGFLSCRGEVLHAEGRGGEGVCGESLGPLGKRPHCHHIVIHL